MKIGGYVRGGFAVAAGCKPLLRRHLTDAEKVKAIREADRINRKDAEERRREAGFGGKGQLTTNVVKCESADQTAEDVGVSRRTVENVRTIETHGTEQDMQDVEEGGLEYFLHRGIHFQPTRSIIQLKTYF